MKKILFYLLIVFLVNFINVSEAQVAITGIVNRYFKVTAFTPASGGTCSSPSVLATVTIGSAYGAANPATLVAGMEVLIIQMEAGAAGVIDRTVTSAAYGNVSNVGGAGNYEYATIASVVGSTVTFTTQLVNTYDPAGKVQLIPTWLGNLNNTNYTTTGIVAPLKYDEVIGVGGVLTISTTGTITLNHIMNAEGMGFRGGDTIGDAYKATWPPNHIQYACCGTQVVGGGLNMETTNGDKYAFPLIMTELRYDVSSPCSNVALRIIKGARKGRGIFGIFVGEEISKGKVANGGGGGHGFNSGGAGGGGFIGGGNGGYELAWACNSSVTQPAGLNHGGRGGLGLAGGTTALYMGGGAGAGHGDGNNQIIAVATTGGFAVGNFRGPTCGGAGGGIVIIKANQLIATGAQEIRAKGVSGGYANQDGAGGGGGGGSIVLQVPAYTGTLLLNASGGEGGHAINPNSSDCHGTGGGGGGGRVILSVGSAPAGVTINTSGGLAGKLLQFNCGSGSCSGGDEYLEVKTSQFCGANVNWGSDVGATSSPTFTTNINTQTCVPLPVVLLNLDVKLIGNLKVGVYWTTTSEINASKYIIERSIDGLNFHQIGIVNAKGITSQISNYSFIDETIVSSEAIYYYRLKTVDFNETFNYSTLNSIMLKGTVLSIYPNPAKENESVIVQYFSRKDRGLFKIAILNNLGITLVDSKFILDKGKNELSLSTIGLSSGIYFIQLNDGYEISIHKFIIE